MCEEKKVYGVWVTGSGWIQTTDGIIIYSEFKETLYPYLYHNKGAIKQFGTTGDPIDIEKVNGPPPPPDDEDAVSVYK